MQDNYMKVLKFLCEYYEVSFEELMNVMKNREDKYVLLLIMKKYRCLNREELKDVIMVNTIRSVNYSLKKAEEKFFINRDFREKYFEIESKIEKII